MATVTLTSDFGNRNYLVGSMKGCLLRCGPAFQLIDISHEIDPFSYNDALYVFGSAWPHFPEGSWHLLMINLFERPKQRILLAYHKRHYFAAPDNGLLPLVLNGLPAQTVSLPVVSEDAGILDCITIIGNAIAAMEKGMSFHELGDEPDDIIQKAFPQPALGNDYIEGQIIFIDRFENVVLNIRKDIFEAVGKGRSFSIALTLNESIERIHQHYGEVREGDKLAFFNAAGYLEIAINKGNAAGLFGLRTAGAAGSSAVKSKIFYERVRIHFYSS